MNNSLNLGYEDITLVPKTISDIVSKQDYDYLRQLMMKNSVKLGYEDITLVPETVSDIVSRQDCDYLDECFRLPIFTAPMDTVINYKNYDTFVKNGIHPIIPRTTPTLEKLHILTNHFEFVALSLEEADEFFLKKHNGKNEITDFRTALLRKKNACKICIDVANGHMKHLLTLIKNIKEKYDNQVIIMSGNIANPKTYIEYNNVGCDYVRVTIGGGSRCTTASNTAVFFPQFSLLKETWELKQEIDGKCKIIADGGIKGYRDIQKALIYADYVMVGNLFNRAIESAGKTVYGKAYFKIFGKKIINPLKTMLYYGKTVKPKNYYKVLQEIKNDKLDVWKEFYGMSTKIAQQRIKGNKQKLKTSEGIVKKQKVEYSLSQWVENEIDYLRSAMSYTNSKNLSEYQNSQWVRISHRSYNN